MVTTINEEYLQTKDGVKIAINHIKAGSDEVLIIAHGWFMTKDSSYFTDMAEAFSQYFDVISMDFRGHGKSSGFYTFTSKEPMDLKAVVEYAKKQYSKIYLMGFSLGGALVLIHSAVEKDVDKVIAVSAPYSFIRIENQMWRKEAWSHSLRKFEFIRWVTVRPSLIIGEKIRPIDIVDKVDNPTLFIAGERDVTVHPWHSKCLYNKAKCKKHFEFFENCCHAEDLFYQERDRFIWLCTDWLLKENEAKDVKEVSNLKDYISPTQAETEAKIPVLIHS